jgi:hypothetical protein
MTWLVENLQFVVFHAPAENWDAYQVWFELFKVAPDGYQRHPDQTMRASNANGTYAGLTLQIQCQVGRIDLIVLGQIDGHFPYVKDGVAALAVCKELAMKLAASKNCLRLALVGVLFENFKSLPEANKHFFELTRQGNIPAGASDLIFGMNVRRQFTQEGYVLNRLLRWTALVKQLMQIHVGVMTQEHSVPIDQPAVVLNIDVNTVVRPTPFKANIIKDVVQTLFAEHVQLREEGYAALVR